MLYPRLESVTQLRVGSLVCRPKKAGTKEGNPEGSSGVVAGRNKAKGIAGLGTLGKCGMREGLYLPWKRKNQILYLKRRSKVFKGVPL